MAHATIRAVDRGAYFRPVLRPLAPAVRRSIEGATATRVGAGSAPPARSVGAAKCGVWSGAPSNAAMTARQAGPARDTTRARPSRTRREPPRSALHGRGSSAGRSTSGSRGRRTPGVRGRLRSAWWAHSRSSARAAASSRGSAIGAPAWSGSRWSARCCAIDRTKRRPVGARCSTCLAARSPSTFGRGRARLAARRPNPRDAGALVAIGDAPRGGPACHYPARRVWRIAAGDLTAASGSAATTRRAPRELTDRLSWRRDIQDGKFSCSRTSSGDAHPNCAAGGF